MTTETAIRKSKQQLIVEYMTINLGKKFGTMELHIKFGTSFRARVSDINKDEKCPIVIHNDTHVQGQSEASVYWSTPRKQHTCYYCGKIHSYSDAQCNEQSVEDAS